MSYSYVHTTTEVIERGLNKQLLRPYVKKYLYSLYNGFSNSNFGYDSLDKLSNNITRFYNNLYPDEKLMIDLENLKLSIKLRDLYVGDKRYKNDEKEISDNIEVLKSDISIRKNVISWLKNQDETLKIQTLI